jgi:HlyD family secretion protein
MRKGRITWRYGIVGVGLIVTLVAVSGTPSLLKRLLRQNAPIAALHTAPVRRTDLTVTMTTSGRVESSERTIIECQLEPMDVGVRGMRLGAGGASTILSVVPEGSTVKEGDVLCVLDSSDYEELLRQQVMTVERCQADHLAAELNLQIARTALEEYRDGLLLQNREELEGKIALAESDLERAKERLAWTRRMHDKGYTSEGQLKTEEFSLEKSSSQVDDGKQALTMFEKYYAPKYLHILQSEILGAEATLGFQEARLSRHKDRLELARKQVENCTIRAPHEGFVIYANDERQNLIIEPGLTVRQRQRLFYLPDLGHMEVEAMLHESVADEVKPGMTAEVRFEALPDGIYEGHVTSVAPLPSKQDFFSDVNYFVGIVKLDTIPEGLKPGMTAEVSIRTLHCADVLAIPNEALTIEGGKDVCYVAADQQVERREVKLGQHTRDLLEVTEGLGEGEAVVLEPRNSDVAGLAQPERSTPLSSPTEQGETVVTP